MSYNTTQLASRSPARDGFQQLPPSRGTTMAAPHDHIEEIPLEKVASRTSTTGNRKPASTMGTAVNSSGDSLPKRPRIGRRKTNTGLGAFDTSGEEPDGTMTKMGKLYKTVLNFSVVTRYFIYVLPLAAVLAIPIVLGIVAVPQVHVGGVRMVWFFTWIEAVWLSLWVSKIFAHYVPVIFQFLVGVVSPGSRKYYLIIKALHIPLSLVGWMVASLLSFAAIMIKNPDTRAAAVHNPSLNSLQPGFQYIMGQLLSAFLVCSLIFLVERAIIQLISINYHRKQFDDKIKDNKRSIWLLGLLYDASRTLFPAYCPEFVEEDYIINDALNLSALGGNGKKHGIANPMRLIQNVGHGVGRIGDKVGAVVGTVAQEITGKKVFDLESGHSIVIEALEKTRSCEALARRLWLSFVVEGRDALYLDDVVEVLGPEHRTEAEESFSAIDRDGNGDISLDEMILTVTEIGRARKSLASSMHDVDQAIHVLDNLLMTVVGVLCIFVLIAFLNHGFFLVLSTTGTALLSLSFVFATTCQEVLGSCIFLFVKHPFDIGDRVDITKERLVVERISLLYSVFKNVQNGKTVQIPNIVLNQLWIDNITRSKAMREQLSVFVSFDTTFDDVTTLRAELLKFVRDKDNSRDFQPELDIQVVGIAEMNKMELQVQLQYKGNWANETVRSARRSKFMCALVLALRRVPIYGPGGGAAPLGSADAPSYSVALPVDVAQRNKDAYAAGKEAKRLVPSQPASAPAPAAARSQSPAAAAAAAAGGNMGAEYVALQALNSRPPATDPLRDDTWAARDDVSALTVDGPAGDDRSGLLDREAGGASRGRRAPNQTLRDEAMAIPVRAPGSVTYAARPGDGGMGLGPATGPY